MDEEYEFETKLIRDNIERLRKAIDEAKERLVIHERELDSILCVFKESRVIKPAKPFKEEDLDLGDVITFVTLAGGYYGVYKGTIEWIDGQCEVADISMVYSKNDTKWCSHRVEISHICSIEKF